MADRKREKRRAKKLAKKRKKRASASRAGTDLNPTAQARTDGREGRSWGVGECYLSENWHEQGAHVHAIVSRTNGGRAVASLFEVDLGEKGVVDARSLGGITPDHVRGECVRISEETGTSMVDVAPALIAHVVAEGRRFGTEQGHPQASGLDKALELLGGIDPDDTPFEVELGRPDGAEPGGPSGEPTDGWFSSIKRRLLG